MAENSDVVAWLDLLTGLADSIRERSDAPGTTPMGVRPSGCWEYVIRPADGLPGRIAEVMRRA